MLLPRDATYHAGGSGQTVDQKQGSHQGIEINMEEGAHH